MPQDAMSRRYDTRNEADMLATRDAPRCLFADATPRSAASAHAAR